MILRWWDIARDLAIKRTASTFWRASDIDALFRKWLKEQGFLIRIGW